MDAVHAKKNKHAQTFVDCDRQRFVPWQLHLNTEDLQARASEFRDAQLSGNYPFGRKRRLSPTSHDFVCFQLYASFCASGHGFLPGFKNCRPSVMVLCIALVLLYVERGQEGFVLRVLVQTRDCSTTHCGTLFDSVCVHGVIASAASRSLNLGCATGQPSFEMSCSFRYQILAQLAFLGKVATMHRLTLRLKPGDKLPPPRRRICVLFYRRDNYADTSSIPQENRCKTCVYIGRRRFSFAQASFSEQT